MENLSNEVVVHKNEGEIEYLQFRRLNEYPEMKHCYTMRHNGIDFTSSQNKEILNQTYDIICKVMGFDREAIVKPYQTHTDKVEIVQEGKEEFSEVDGVITNKENITLCTTSADCTALLFYDPIKKIIGDVHSGWRGTIQKIGQKAVKKMIEAYGCNPEDIICCICPHIRGCHFEVEEDVVQLFLDAFSDMEQIEEYITKGDIVNGKQKYYIDTTRINIQMLKQIGLKQDNILDSGICTVCEAKHFHSYRTDKEQSGRNGAMICLKD